jgi:hypothetical protein
LLTSLGYPEVPVLVTPNPVVYLSEAQINERIDHLLLPIVASFDIPAAGRADGQDH